ncbi:MAG: dipeptide epimerase [Chitinophagaceae bacterium]|nr:dipeptide epimerase [Chitinophagaceae bacterium]MCW5928328.1 dipeptide epimerase [Chitinophagaceae bacterium]
MKIVHAKAYLKNLRLKKPYTIARERIDDVENVFLELQLANGITGIGAANPSPEVVNESPAETLRNLEEEIVPWITGKDIRHFNDLVDYTRRKFPGKPGTHAALDIALHDAFGSYLNLPVVDFYGRQHTALPTSVTIGIMDTRQTLEEAAVYQKAGFRILKLKTGQDPEQDAERVIKLQEDFRNYFTIRVDANTGYTLEQLRRFLQLTRRHTVELIEQPLLPEEDKALDSLPAEERRLLAADESLKDVDSAFQLGCLGRYGIYNIKLMKCGGIKGAFSIASVAAPAGIQLFWGCNDESIVSITAALHTAFACNHTKYLDLDGSFDLAEDIVTGGFQVKEGMMSITGGPGLGLKKLT